MASTAPVVFSHFTALEILRRLPPEMLEQRSRLRQWPRHPVSRSQLDAAVARVEKLFPTPFDTRRSETKGRTFGSSTPVDPAADAVFLRRPIHFITGCSAQNRAFRDATGHLSTKPVQAGSVIRLDNEIYVCSPETAFLQYSVRLPSMSLMELGFELCGAYRTSRTGTIPSYDAVPLTTASKLMDAILSAPAGNAPKKALECVRWIVDDSASVRETKLLILLALPRCRGGYGLGLPVMNLPVATTETAKRIYPVEFVKCDIAWPKAKVDVEYQSRYAHEGERARIRDSRRTNALGEMGWNVVAVTNEELDSLSACDAIASRIRKALKLKPRPTPKNYDALKQSLRWELRLP